MTTGTPFSDATFAIIAGGRAQRLGSVAKGRLQVGGRAVLDWLLDHGPMFGAVLLVTNDPEPYPTFPGLVVPDVIQDRGAPGGVHAALDAATTPWVLAVAVDMPFVKAAVLERLLDERAETVDAVCFERSGRLEPLLGLYRASLAARWREALAAEPSFRDILQRLRTRVLPESELRRVDPEGTSLVSLNTREDLARWGATFPGTA